MESISVDDGTYRDLTLIARAAGITHGEAVTLLVDHFQRSAGPERTPRPPGAVVAVHATYQGHRIDGEFDPATASLTVISDPTPGKWYRSPSGAAKAVVSAIKPGVTPNRSGYDFWFVSSTGKTLASIRNKR
ncbi:hypothetical protein ACFY36_44825 [Actinoplanes sp. NPDC000266]